MLLIPFHRRHLRRTAAVTLSAWLLALLATVVNACLLQPDLRNASASSALVRVALSEPVVRAFQVEHGDHGPRAGQADDSADASQASCLKFCDDESSTVAKGETAQPGLAGLPVAFRTNWHAVVPATAVAMRTSVERPLSQGPPLVIRFLRLTI